MMKGQYVSEENIRAKCEFCISLDTLLYLNG